MQTKGGARVRNVAAEAVCVAREMAIPFNVSKKTQPRISFEMVSVRERCSWRESH